ncbi:MAG: Cell division protein FtsQ [Holosporales bacterium]
MTQEKPEKTKRSSVVQKRLRSRRWNGASSIVYISGVGLFLLATAIIFLTGYHQTIAAKLEQGFYQLQKTLNFKVKEIVIQGRHKVPIDILKEKIGLNVGDPIFKTRVEDIKNALLEIEWIKSCTVYRQLPDQYFIILEERIPIAKWMSKNKAYLIDADGIAIELDNPKNITLPTFYGDGAAAKAHDILLRLKKFPNIEKNVVLLVRINHRRWDIILPHRVIIKLPEEFKNEKNSQDALGELDEMIAKNLLNNDRIESVDLRIANKKFIKKAVLMPLEDSVKGFKLS